MVFSFPNIFNKTGQSQFLTNSRGASLGQKLQIVVLERPIDTWSDPFTTLIFSKLVEMKLAGYAAHHPYGSLAVDKTDFFGDHILVGDVSSGDFVPITGWRSVTLDACKLFKNEFSAIAAARKSAPHVEYVEHLLASNPGKNIRYCSAYTINPNIRDRNILVQIKPLLAAMGYWFYKTDRTDISLLVGNVTAKVDRMFESLGYQPLEWNGEVLPSFPIAFYDMEVRMFKLGEPTDLAIESATQYHELWERRIVQKRKDVIRPARSVQGHAANL